MMLGTLALLGGCKRLLGANCNKPQVYATADSLPPLHIPVGLDAPDTRGALHVPELNEPEAPRGPKVACLDEPPPFTPPAAAR
jgi:uncharacterized lipoprotein